MCMLNTWNCEPYKFSQLECKCEWYSFIIIICVSLITNEVEYSFVCLLALWFPLWIEFSYPLSHFKNWLAILNINNLSLICIANIFSKSAICIFCSWWILLYERFKKIWYSWVISLLLHGLYFCDLFKSFLPTWLSYSTVFISKIR